MTCLWINPHYKSPQHDLGSVSIAVHSAPADHLRASYDISDYQAVHEPYGTLEDCDELIKGANERGMKVLFDLVINHTSDEHRWFIESRSSVDNPKHDWYIWRPARYINGERHPPTNWQGAFQGSTWEYDEGLGLYYLHLFVPQQPGPPCPSCATSSMLIHEADLNWEKDEVRHALYEEAVRFWLKRGVAGFRIDTANLYSKRYPLKDFPVTVPGQPYQPGVRLHTLRLPRSLTAASLSSINLPTDPAFTNSSRRCTQKALSRSSEHLLIVDKRSNTDQMRQRFHDRRAAVHARAQGHLVIRL